MIVLALNMGVRLASEGLTLEWDAVDFRRQTITIRNAYAKNKQERTIKLNQPALETLVHLKAIAQGPQERRTDPSAPALTKHARRRGLRELHLMISGTPGALDSARKVSMIGRYRNWEAGRRSRWCNGIRIPTIGGKRKQ
jgi:integrase